MFLTAVRPVDDANQVPSFLPGGRPAVVLVHGVLGGPAELRSIGAALNRDGWTVQGVRLPGFGPEFERLAERRHLECVAAVRTALIAFQREPVLMLDLSFSMGGASALQFAAEAWSDALVLRAPLARFSAHWQGAALPAARLDMRRFRPFRRADHADPRIGRRFDCLSTGIDPDAPDPRRSRRGLRLPTSLRGQRHRVGRRADRLAPRADMRTMVVQRVQDTVVRPEQTRRLLQRLAAPIRYVEVTAGDDLPDARQAAWQEVEAAIHDFAAAAGAGTKPGSSALAIPVPLCHNC